jgi:hypothetical protein
MPNFIFSLFILISYPVFSQSIVVLDSLDNEKPFSCTNIKIPKELELYREKLSYECLRSITPEREFNNITIIDLPTTPPLSAEGFSWGLKKCGCKCLCWKFSLKRKPPKYEDLVN